MDSLARTGDTAGLESTLAAARKAADESGVASSALNSLADTKAAAAPDLLKSVEDGKTAMENIKANPDTSERGLTAAEKAASRTAKLKTFFGNNWGKLLVGGMLVGTLGALAGAFLDSTDGETVTITNITVVDSSHIKVSFDPNSVRPSGPLVSPAFFHPAVGDTFTFESSTPTTPDLYPTTATVTSKVDSKTVILGSSVTSVQTNPTSWGSMQCNSTYGSQLGTTIGEGTNWLATNVLQPTIDALANTVSNVGSSLICTSFPTLCKRTTWIASGVISCIILAIILFITFSRK